MAACSCAAWLLPAAQQARRHSVGLGHPGTVAPFYHKVAPRGLDHIYFIGSLRGDAFAEATPEFEAFTRTLEFEAFTRAQYLANVTALLANRAKKARASTAKASSGPAASPGSSFPSSGTSRNPSGGGRCALVSASAAMVPPALVQTSLVGDAFHFFSTLAKTSSSAMRKAPQMRRAGLAPAHAGLRQWFQGVTPPYPPRTVTLGTPPPKARRVPNVESRGRAIDITCASSAQEKSSSIRTCTFGQRGRSARSPTTTSPRREGPRRHATRLLPPSQRSMAECPQSICGLGKPEAKKQRQGPPPLRSQR